MAITAPPESAQWSIIITSRTISFDCWWVMGSAMGRLNDPKHSLLSIISDAVQFDVTKHTTGHSPSATHKRTLCKLRSFVVVLWDINYTRPFPFSRFLFCIRPTGCRTGILVSTALGGFVSLSLVHLFPFHGHNLRFRRLLLSFTFPIVILKNIS